MYTGLRIPVAAEPPSRARSCVHLPCVSHPSSVYHKRQRRRHKSYAAFFVDQDNVDNANSEEDLKRERISAKASVMASISQVWRVLTDYEELAQVVPFLEESKPLKFQNSRRLQLFQRAAFSNPFWKLDGEGILDVEERMLPLGLREIRFRMIKGDFEEYYGRWLLEPNQGGNTCTLRFDAIVSPRGNIPEMLLGHAIQVWLPLSIFSIVRAAEQIARKRASAPGFIAAALEENVQLKGENPSDLLSEWTAGGWARNAVQTRRKREWHSLSPESSQDEPKDAAKEPLEMSGGKSYLQDTIGIPKEKTALFKKAINGSSTKGPLPYLGLASVPIPQTVVPDNPRIRFEKRKPSYHPFSINASKKSVSEVHLRKLDVDGVLHRRVVLMVSIKASRVQVWSVLADYDHLAETLPNVETSEAVELAPGAPERYRRLRQVVSMLKSYVSLRWEYDLDVVERKFEQIQFRKFRSDESVFQGKFILAEGASPNETILEFAVEYEVPMDNGAIKLMEHTLESVVFEELPLNLMALKEKIERMFTSSTSDEAQNTMLDPALSSEYDGHHVSARDLIEDFDYLQRVIQYHYSARGKMFPTREELRAGRLSTVEKAIMAHGGRKKVAQKMGWQLKTKVRRPRGYWKDMSNIRTEVDAFCSEHNLAPGVMPKKSDLRKAGRNDIRRAIEQLGGLHAVATELGLGMDAATCDLEVQKNPSPNPTGESESEAAEVIPFNKKMLLDVRDLDNIDYVPSGVQ